MEDNKTQNAIKKLTEGLKELENKTSKIFFYVFDTKGTPSGSLSYIYELALELKGMGYNVHMLHSEKEFVGVGEWMGEKYASLPHHNSERGDVAVDACDILIIPEIYGNVMAQTKEFPCKRIVLIQNTNYLCDTMVLTATFDDLKIHECITTSEGLKERINTWFPKLHVNVIRPKISSVFHKNDKPQKLVINIIGKEPNEINRIVKPFYWKYPNYNWVSFNDVRNLPKETYAEALRDGCVTVWIDTKTDFGYGALEAMASGNIVIGKVPENEPDWLLDKNGVIRDNGLWFYKDEIGVDMIANVVETIINEAIPDEIFNETANTIEYYSEENHRSDVEKVITEGIIEERKKELTIILNTLKNNANKKTDK